MNIFRPCHRSSLGTVLEMCSQSFPSLQVCRPVHVHLRLPCPVRLSDLLRVRLSGGGEAEAPTGGALLDQPLVQDHPRARDPLLQPPEQTGRLPWIRVLLQDGLDGALTSHGQQHLQLPDQILGVVSCSIWGSRGRCDRGASILGGKIYRYSDT